MAFLKFSRDKRGYEHFYLLQPTSRGKARPRVLYWFRTPPNIKVGRSPFDPEIRRALEAQNPDVAFDWEAIVHTPIPPPMEPERWRERRRVERALRAAETEEAASIADADEPSSQTEIPTERVQAIEQPAEESPAVAAEDEVIATADPATTSNVLSLPSLSPASTVSTVSPGTPEGGTPGRGHRRRRRRRGRRKPQQVQGSQVQGPQAESSPSQEPAVQDSGEPGDEEP